MRGRPTYNNKPNICKRPTYNDIHKETITNSTMTIARQDMAMRKFNKSFVNLSENEKKKVNSILKEQNVDITPKIKIKDKTLYKKIMLESKVYDNKAMEQYEKAGKLTRESSYTASDKERTVFNKKIKILMAKGLKYEKKSDSLYDKNYSKMFSY